MSPSDSVTHTSRLVKWTPAEGKGSWHFFTIDGLAGEAIAAHEAIRRMELGSGRGFGSVKVTARIGTSEWNTSVFPSKERGGYLLPVKAAIRKVQELAEGSVAEVELDLL